MFLLDLLHIIVLFKCAFTLRLNPQGCSVSISDLNPEPIVIDDQTHQFLLPHHESGKVHLCPGCNVIISCPGTNLTLQSNNLTTIRAVCLSNATFSINNSKQIYFYDIRCANKTRSTVKETLKQCGYVNTTQELQIGFELNLDQEKTSFVPQISLCFDNSTKQTLYVKYKLSKSIAFREHGVKRPNFIEGKYYKFNKTISKIYSRNFQRYTINNQLGLEPNSTKYIKKNRMFLSRGHLAPKADFIYEPQQRATFYYLNTAPQWQSFNGGEWHTVENDIRQLINRTKDDFEVYTGVYGVATLPHAETGEETALFLYDDKLPVPAIFWKVVINTKTRNGVAIVGVNNPYHRERVVSCEDVLSSLNWLSLKSRRAKDGAVYACQVEEFRKTVGFLPEIKINGLLI